jgi:hypothetical protein
MGLGPVRSALAGCRSARPASRSASAAVATAMIRFVGSGRWPAKNSLPVSTTSASASTATSTTPVRNPRAQPSAAAGRYISATLPRLNSATASLV